MITKIRLKVKGHEEKTFMAEVEQTRQGYKFTMPDGSGIEIYGNLIEKLVTIFGMKIHQKQADLVLI